LQQHIKAQPLYVLPYYLLIFPCVTICSVNTRKREYSAGRHI
jgi:hypothetical protein